MPNPNLPIAGNYNTYIGARYVPILVNEDIEFQWDIKRKYEPLNIVLWEGNSYTSRTFIPPGIDIHNLKYWACTGNYNAQMAILNDKYVEMLKESKKLKQQMIYANNPATLSWDVMLSNASKDYYSYSAPNEPIYGAFQGITYTGTSFIAMLIPTQYYYNYYNVSDLAILVEYDTNFTEIRRSNPLKLYHGGSLEYYEGNIYVNAGASNNEIRPYILVVDYNTFQIKQQITLNVGSNFIFFKDCYMYTGTRSHIEKRQLSGELVQSTPLTGLPALHSMKPYFEGGYVATMNDDNNVILLDDNFKIVKIYPLYGMFRTQGEIKDIAIMNSDIFITFNDRCYKRTSESEITEVYNLILRMNLKKNVEQFEFSRKTYAGIKAAHVNTSSTAKIMDGTSNSPFKTLMQAIRFGANIVNLQESNGCVIMGADINLRISSSNDKNVIHLVDLYNCDISGSGVTITSTIVPSELFGCKLDIVANCSAILKTRYCSINSGRNDWKLEELAISDLIYPLNYVSNYNQKWTIKITGDSANIGLSRWSIHGIYIGKLRLTVNGKLYIANISAVGGGNLNQSVFCSSGADVIRCVLSFNLENETLTIVPSQCYLNNEAATCTVNECILTHII